MSFYTQYAPYALETERKTGISHLFILAQAALESGWGTHAPGNMFFGVKATRNTPPQKRQLLITTEVLSSPNLGTKFPKVISITPRPDGKYLYKVKDWFCRYDSPEASFTHHAQLLTSNPRYAKALAVKTDPYLFAQAIAQATYATDPHYAEKLIEVIKTIERERLKESSEQL